VGRFNRPLVQTRLCLFEQWIPGREKGRSPRATGLHAEHARQRGGSPSDRASGKRQGGYLYDGRGDGRAGQRTRRCRPNQIFANFAAQPGFSTRKGGSRVLDVWGAKRLADAGGFTTRWRRHPISAQPTTATPAAPGDAAYIRERCGPGSNPVRSIDAWLKCIQGTASRGSEFLEGFVPPFGGGRHVSARSAKCSDAEAPVHARRASPRRWWEPSRGAPRGGSKTAQK